MPISTTGPDGRIFVPVIDTSAWQFPEYDSKRGVLGPGAVAPNLTAARDKGVAGIIHRVSNGLTADPSYELTIAAAVDAGLDHGAYSYLQPGRSAADVQARRVLQLIARGPASTLPVMADCEHFDGEMDMSPDEFAAWLRVWLDIVAAGTGRQPIIYTASWWWNRESTVGFEPWDSILARYPAQSPHRPQETWAPPPADPTNWAPWAFDKGPTGPPLPRGETRWNGWQFTSWLQASDFGFKPGPRMDGNIVLVDAWERWAGSSSRMTDVFVPPAVVTPSSGDDEMYDAKLHVTNPAGAFTGLLLDGMEVRHTTSGSLYAALRCPEVTMTTAEFALELDNLRTFGPLSDTAQRDLGQAIAAQWEARHVAPIVVPLGELFVRLEAP